MNHTEAVKMLRNTIEQLMEVLDQYGLQLADEALLLTEDISLVHADITISSQQPLSEWMPIETAPRDGTDLLVYLPEDYNKINICSYERNGRNGFDWCSARCVDGLEVGCPTHWMPLPDEPKGDTP